MLSLICFVAGGLIAIARLLGADWPDEFVAAEFALLFAGLALGGVGPTFQKRQ
jgi:hypothetical protein